MQAQWIKKIQIGAPQCQVRDHKKNIYWILSLRLMDWAHRHSGFEKYILGLPNARHTARKKDITDFVIEAHELAMQTQ